MSGFCFLRRALHRQAPSIGDSFRGSLQASSRVTPLACRNLDHGQVQLTLPVAPWNVVEIAVTPGFTPTTVPEPETVRRSVPRRPRRPGVGGDVLLAAVEQRARADIWTESVRPTAHGDGEIGRIAETVADETMSRRNRNACARAAAEHDAPAAPTNQPRNEVEII